ncbi:hypothetical protein [Clostridium sp.]|uniref:hypothetical protein n=1 Tax=Clostridium sp. TaxID=1506 RepID=UPI001B45361D|nr:hypothetical protein [Clostridium sp.]MBP3916364.1 hypothetical protein [Clostridium sp.]
MEAVQDALVNLLVTVAVGVIGIVGAYTTVCLNKITANIKSKTNKIENENQKALIESAIERVNDLVRVNVIKAQETLVKEIVEKTEDGIFDKSDLRAVADVVKNDVMKQMGEQVTELVKVEINDLEGYVLAVIEKTLAELKGQI